jgi:ADP-ribosylglycohydrolase
MELINRVRGCLLAGAVGDALGAPVEFLSTEQIYSKYGSRGITELTKAYGVEGAITDDTQMTLFTAEGLLRGLVRGRSRGVSSIYSVIHHAYLRWLLTQDRHSRTEVGEDGWLIQERRLWSQRAPGNSCLAALSASPRFGEFAENNSKGCGGVMRVAPIGLLPLGDSFELGAEAAHLTHGHPTGYIASGAFAYLIEQLVKGLSLREAIDVTHQRTVGEEREQGVAAETSEAIAQALRLADGGQTPTPALIESIGGGWIAEEALAISIYCALVSDDLESALILAVNHGGDSDSTGAITGNILGCLLGEQAIPKHWLETLELRDVIETVANDLVYVPETYEGEGYGPHDTEIWERYPGW